MYVCVRLIFRMQLILVPLFWHRNKIQYTFIEICITVMYLSGPNDRLVDTIRHAELLSIGKFSVFPTIHDAVLYFQSSAADNI